MKNNHPFAVQFATFTFAFLAMNLLFGWVVMMLWNWLTPALFGWKLVGYWQALGLMIICRTLTAPWAWPGGLGGPWRRQRQARDGCMTPTETNQSA